MARLIFAAALAGMVLATPALAEDRPSAPGAPPLDAPATSGSGQVGSGKDGKPGPVAQKPSNPEAEARRAVDDLLARLAKTDDPAAAKRIAGAVQALWMRSGSDTVDLLTARANEALRAKKLDVAVKLMDEAVSLRPSFAEAWNRRATLHFASKDYQAAMADIHQTIVREPRHFGAWLALGRILSQSGFDRQALAAFRKTLEIYPAVEGLKKEVDELTLKVEGQPI